jgi:glycerol-3-phosphate dehydrogenase (NAD(P)+)
VTLAAREAALAAALVKALGRTFRPTIPPRGGVPAQSVYRRCIARAGGSAPALRRAHNARFAELIRFGKAFGARAETLTGLSA